MIKDYYKSPWSVKGCDKDRIRYYNSMIPWLKAIANNGEDGSIVPEHEVFIEDGWKIVTDTFIFMKSQNSKNLRTRSSFIVNETAGVIICIGASQWNIEGTLLVEVYTGNCYECQKIVNEKWEKVLRFRNLFKENGKPVSSDAEYCINNSLFNWEDIYNVVKMFYGIELKGRFGCYFSDFIKLTRYFGNRTESVLRQESPWLLKGLMKSLNFGKEMPAKIKNLKQFFGVNQQELNYFLSQKDESRIAFFLLSRQFEKDCSVKKAMTNYDKVVKINEKYELDKEFYSWSEKQVSLKGARGRIVLKTKQLPKIMSFYSIQKLSGQISVSKYVNYILNEKKKNPDLRIEELEDQIVDYNRMAHQILETKEFVLPYNIVNAHTTMVDNYNRVMSEGSRHIDTENNIKKLNSHYNDELYGYEDDTFCIRRPIIPSDLHNEGMKLNHCVGSYAQRVIDGKTKIFFVRKKSNPEKALVTIEVDNNGRLVQERGKGNRQTTQEETTFIKNWLDSYNAKKEAWLAEGKRKASNSDFVDSIIRERQKTKNETIAEVLTTFANANNFANEANVRC